MKWHNYDDEIEMQSKNIKVKKMKDIDKIMLAKKKPKRK
jgi:hypothetical protein